MKNDEYFMRLALREAVKGRGFTKTNPLVGAVIVKNERIISRGYHEFFGGPHAEINALRKAGTKARGADLYVTLEPCSTTGKTPPCTDAILKAGIKRVIVAEIDPNPVNRLKGIEILRKNNITVTTGTLEKEASEVNAFFHVIMEKKRPFVTLKLAMSLDGKIATCTRDSKWITNEKSRAAAHRLRSKSDAILAGKNTILYDNPFLTARIPGVKRQPDKILLDFNCEIPFSKNVFNSSAGERIFIGISSSTPKKTLCRYTERGIIPVPYPGKDDLAFFLGSLLKYNIGTVLVEGGGIVAGALLRNNLIDRMALFYGPLIIGGTDSIDSFPSVCSKTISGCKKVKNIRFEKIDECFMIECTPEQP